MNIEGKVAIITGSTRGIGLGIAEGFIKAGAFVAICGTKKENAQKTVNELIKKYDKARVLAVGLDVTDDKSIEKAIKEVSDCFGRIDILVNNAGITSSGPIEKTTNEDWNNIININTTGMFKCIRESLKYMKSGSSIINITSMNGIYGSPYQAAYSASKGAIIAMTKSMAKELGPKGIRVNAIAPGMIETDMVKGAVNAEMKEKLINLTPLRRIGTPEDLQGISLLLASDASSFITNTIISVDGGIVM